MIQFMDESSGNVVGIRVAGKLTALDYRQTLVPRLQSLIERFGSVKALFFMDANFKGWNLGAAWANTCLVLQQRRTLEKIAMVGGPKWEEFCVKALASPLMEGELCTFRADQIAEAWKWLREPTRGHPERNRPPS